MTDEPTPDAPTPDEGSFGNVPPGDPPPPTGPPSGPPPISYGYPQPAPVPLTPSEERLWAMLAHLSYFVFSIFGPIIIMVVFGPRSAFVGDQAKEALNFHITLLIAGIVSGILILVGIGLILLPAVAIYGLVFAILAAVKANDGEPYRYPLTLRLVS
jgi:uncharacterized Tic20 family protein